MSLRRLFYLFIAGLLLVGCSPTSTVVLNPKSPMAGQQANLYDLLTYMGAGVFLFVVVLLVIALVNGSRRAKAPGEPYQHHGNTLIEILWTAIPILLVLFIFFMTVRTIQATAVPPKTSSDINVRVIGHRWWWEFDYPDLGIKTANQMHIPLGRNVQVEVTSGDVVHSFWIPNLNGKIDAIPGQINRTWFRTDIPGTYDGHCTEYCGLQHANMSMQVIAQSQADFDAWVKAQQQPAPQPQTDAEKAGAQIVTQGICSSCHTVNGTNAQGMIGPNLTHLHSRTIIVGGVLPLDDGNLMTWLRDPGAVKPGNLMSNVRLTDQQIQQVLAYLATLK